MNNDLISRQAAIDALEDALYDLDEHDFVDNAFIEEELKRVPNIQFEKEIAKTGRWMPIKPSMSDINLKPCPFCGNKVAPQIMDQNQALWSDPDYDGDLRIVVCCAARNGGCGASTGFCDNDDEAVAAWNRRNYTEDTPSTLPEAFTEQIMRRFTKEE